MAIIQNIQPLDPTTLEYQDYSIEDTSLISSSIFSSNWNDNRDYIEYYVFNLNGETIESDLNLVNYLSTPEGLIINPEQDIQNIGFIEGTFNVLYHFFNPLLSSSIDTTYYISEISSDRTELKINTNQLSSIEITSGYNALKQILTEADYYKDFYLNFGDNQLIIANNVLIDTSNSANVGIYIKLYEPLPSEFGLKSKLWVVDKVADSVAYQIELLDDTIFVDTTSYLQGPNFNLKIKDEINNSTDFLNFSQLKNSPSSSLSNQLGNILKQKGIKPNIDYTNYEEFAFFSSVETRIENFYYKLQLLESYQSSSTISTSTINTYLSSNSAVYDKLTTEVIEGFDGFEYYMYFSSGSKAWPKSTSTKPYSLYSTTSPEADAWLTENLPLASDYDRENVNNLVYSIPEFIREDTNNANYELFVEMIGQHFDSIWIYIKDISNKYDRDNRVDYGASRDVIADILRDFGVKIYQNNFSNQDLYNAFLGIGVSGSLLPPTGSELITNFITASSEIIPLNDINQEIYSRLYHNLPTILKKKGTIEGLRTIINCYGVPNTVLRISEFGGKDRDNSNDWDYWYNKANYSFTPSGSGGWVEIPWTSSANSGEYPKTVELRFKAPNLAVTTTYSQSIAVTADSQDFAVVIEYTGSLFTSGSYSGSIINPENTFATIKFINETNDISASVYMPVFNNTWVSLMITEIPSRYDYIYTLHAANKLYTGNDGAQIGFYQSSSCSGSIAWANSGTLKLPYSSSYTFGGKTYQPFTGSIQEVRYYDIALNTQSFQDYVMNPLSIEGNALEGSESSLNSLFFRAPLGAVLDNSGSGNQSRSSVHTSVTGSYIPTSSFDNGSSYNLSGSYTFSTNEEYIFLDQIVTGVKNRVNDKVRIDVQTTASGDTLSPLVRIETNPPQYQNYTRDLTTLEVGFSPQNEINDDIINQLGFFNIGEFLSNPSLLYTEGSNQYPELERFRNNFFEKYTHNYNLKDYVRLIKYFDNSLFKLLKDFIPARVEASTGVIIKQHLLERNRAPVPLPTFTNETYSGSISIGSISGGTLGSFTQFNEYAFNPEGQSLKYVNVTQPTGSFIMDLTQSFNEIEITPLGNISEINSKQAEFYTGEFEGSDFIVTTQSLNPGCAIFLDANTIALEYSPIVFSSTFGNTIEQFSSLVPKQGQMLILYSGETYQNGFQGVQYIKIHKEDIDGFDQSLYIQQTSNLRVRFASGAIYNLPIETISESPTFYTYQLSENNISSIIDDTTYRKASNIITGSITYTLNPTPGPFTSSISYLDAQVDATGSERRTSVTPLASFTQGDWGISPETIVVGDFYSLYISSLNGGGSSFIGDLMATYITSSGWVVVLDGVLDAETYRYTFSISSNNGIFAFGGTNTTHFSASLTEFSSSAYFHTPPPLLDNLSTSIHFYHYQSDPIIVTGFMPSALNGSRTDTPTNFSNIGTNTIDAGKKGSTILYANSIFGGSPSADTTGSIRSVFTSNPFSFIQEVTTGNGTELTSYNYTSNITSSGEANDLSIFNFNIKANFSGSVTYNNIGLNTGYNFRFGIAKETTPLAYSDIISLPLIGGTSSLQLSQSFSEDVIFQYSLTEQNIVSFSPGDDLSFFIEDMFTGVNGIPATFTSGGTLRQGLSSSLDQYFENIIISLTASDSLGNLIPTQSFSTSSTIIEPYLPQPFYNTDCDVLLGSVEKYENNPFYMESRYASIGPQFNTSNNSSFIPQNINRILNNTAIRSTVKPYNYNYTPHIRSRYSGTKIISSDVNQVSGGTITRITNNKNLFFDDRLLDINGAFILPKQINTMVVSDRIPIKSLKSLAISFKSITDAAPEIKNASVVQVDKILSPSVISITSLDPGVSKGDKPGILDVSNYPQLDGFSYAQPDIENNFSVNDEVNVEIFDIQSFEADQRNLVGVKKVLRGGKRVDPVLYNEIYNSTTKVSTFTSSIPFEVPLEGNTDYEFIARNTGSYTFNPTASTSVDYNWTTESKAVSGVNAEFSLVTDTYTFTSASITGVKFSTKVTLASPPSSAIFNKGLFSVKLVKNNNITLEEGLLDITPISTSVTSSITLTMDNFSLFETGDTVKVVITPQNIKSLTTVRVNPLNSDYFKSTQEESIISSVLTSSIWTTGSVDSVWLTSSIGLAQAYGRIPLDIPNSGFSPLIQPFEIKIGDEIRFGGRETNTRLILDVVQSDGSSLKGLDGFQIDYAPKLYIQLDAAPPSGSNITQFMIRRYVDDARFILLKGQKPKIGTTSTGYLTPRFQTPSLSNFLGSTNNTSIAPIG
jgi:hypothetical protein